MSNFKYKEILYFETSSGYDLEFVVHDNKEMYLFIHDKYDDEILHRLSDNDLLSLIDAHFNNKPIISVLSEKSIKDTICAVDNLYHYNYIIGKNNSISLKEIEENVYNFFKEIGTFEMLDELKKRNLI